MSFPPLRRRRSREDQRLTGARSDSSALSGARGPCRSSRLLEPSTQNASPDSQSGVLCQLVAAVDPGVVIEPPTIYGVNLYADLTEALAAVGPVDVVIVAAPSATTSDLPTSH